MENSFYLDLAIAKAWENQCLTYPNPSVGALVQDKNNAIVSIASTNTQLGFAHAEVEAIKQAYFETTQDTEILKLQKSLDIHEYLLKNHNNIFHECTLFVTLEPCNHFGSTPPCSHLIAKLGFKKVVIGVRDNNTVASGGIEYLEKNGVLTQLLNTKKAQNLIYPFVKWNEEDRFVFFKFASHINGSFKGQVSSANTREYMHNLRSKIDLLVIGGNTVRVDRPTLDTRFSSSSKVPDVLIFSKSKEFDKSIDLFKVQDRKVYIEDDFDRLKDYKCIMIEGAQGMLEATKEIVDAYLFLTSHKSKKGINFSVDLDLEKLFCMDNGNDSISWYKKRDEPLL